jgi:dipeptidyl aminopeptidase/acylaminoacyl peptidase
MTAMTTPYGAWPSPITSRSIASGSVGLGGIVLVGDDLWWTEARSSEGGRVVLVHRRADGTIEDVLPAPFNARSRVHEYGGGAVTIAGDAVFFVNFADQIIHRVKLGEAPVPLTEAGPWRFASVVPDDRRGCLIAVRENHGEPGPPTNDIVAVPIDGGLIDGGAIRVLASGHDFYGAPKLSPDGGALVWLTWDLPAMPWDTTTLWRADFRSDGSLGEPVAVAGGVGEAVFQPEFAQDGTLHFVSDRGTGWWNHHAFRDDDIEVLCRDEAEYGLPSWSLSSATYAIGEDGRLLTCRVENGLTRLGEIRGGVFQPLDLPFTEFGAPSVSAGRLAVNAASATEPWRIILVDLSTGAWETVRRSVSEVPDKGYLSTPEPIDFPTGPDGLAVAHAFYYPPRNDDVMSPEGPPPLIVRGHGGPTGAASPAFSLAIQYWTSRGFAVLDVNYRGSTGWGRAFREALYGQWGVADVEDVVKGAEAMVARGLADPSRLAIRGGSAGGYTVLAALAFHDTFTAGCSLYGIGDLEALATDTHKFESRYLDQLIGPYPERRDLYRERSPIHHTENLAAPVIFFQGLDDKVVPPNQAEAMVAALQAKNVPVAYIPFEGEGHGFRKAENIRRALDGELSFYGQIWGFEPEIPSEARVEVMGL